MYLQVTHHGGAMVSNQGRYRGHDCGWPEVDYHGSWFLVVKCGLMYKLFTIEPIPTYVWVVIFWFAAARGLPERIYSDGC